MRGGSRYYGSSGYTLVELLVVMFITMILAGLLFSLYLAANRWVAPWQREITLENTVHRILWRLAADLTYAEQLFAEGDGTWILTYPSGRRVHYRYRDEGLSRNTRPMHDVALPVVNFRLLPSRPETRYALRRRDRETSDEQGPIRVTIRIALQSRERTLAVTMDVLLRRHRPWQPVPIPSPSSSAPDPTFPATGRAVP